MMKRTITIATALLLLSLAITLSPYNMHLARASPYLDPTLARGLSTYPATQTVEVVIVLSHIPTSNDAQSVQSLSTVSAPMTKLPIILSVTTYGNLNKILALKGVVSLWTNRQLTYYGNVNTVNHSYGEIPVQHSWWNDIMSVSGVWNLGYQGQGVTVALVDTGIDASNPSLGYSFSNSLAQSPYRVIQNVKVADIGELVSNAPLGPDQVYLENQINTDTTSGHGTSTAGLVAGTGDGSGGLYKGVAPKANIVGLGTGDVDFVFYVVASYNYILAHQQLYNIKVVSNSWGTDYNCSDNLGNPTNGCDPGTPIQLVTKAAHDAGITVLFAAGNSGPTNPTINPYSEPDWVISVGAGTESKGLTEFSSRGVVNDPAKQPDIVAPGLNVITTKAKTGAVDGAILTTADQGNIVTPYQAYYTTFDGTSAATPQAAGVAALILSAANLTPDQLKAAMSKGADPMLGYLPFQVGAGYTDATHALNSALGQNFQTTKVKAQDFGDQRFTYTQYLGGLAATTGTWISASVPVFQGAQQITLTASWPLPATFEWEVDVYAPNDYAVADCGRTRSNSDCIGPFIGDTSVSYTINNTTLIASLNNPGFTAGTWTVRVFDFNEGSPATLTADVFYAAKAHTSMNNAHSIHVSDSQTGGLTGETAVTQTTTGTVLATTSLASPGSTSVTADVNQATSTVIPVVQIVVVDSNGNIIEVRGAWVTTQADLNARAAQIQQQLLTTTDPAQITALNTELAAIQGALPTAPTTENIPLLP